MIDRDGPVCRRCGVAVRSYPPGHYLPDQIHLDHVHPYVLGGQHTLENLIVCCAQCNLARPRPSRRALSRDRHSPIGPRVIQGRHYWPLGYFPPVTVPFSSDALEVEDAAIKLDTSVAAVIQRAAYGRLVAIHQPLIRIALPKPGPQHVRRLAR